MVSITGKFADEPLCAQFQAFFMVPGGNQAKCDGFTLRFWITVIQTWNGRDAIHSIWKPPTTVSLVLPGTQSFPTQHTPARGEGQKWGQTKSSAPISANLEEVWIQIWPRWLFIRTAFLAPAADSSRKTEKCWNPDSHSVYTKDGPALSKFRFDLGSDSWTKSSQHKAFKFGFGGDAISPAVLMRFHQHQNDKTGPSWVWIKNVTKGLRPRD